MKQPQGPRQSDDNQELTTTSIDVVFNRALRNAYDLAAIVNLLGLQVAVRTQVQACRQDDKELLRLMLLTGPWPAGPTGICKLRRFSSFWNSPGTLK